jgi:thioredoxin-related protein
MLIILAEIAAISAETARAAETTFVESYEKAVSKDSNVLLIFGTEWCGYCKKLKNDLKSLNLSDYKICVIDAEKRKDLDQKYGIKSYPTSVIVRSNKEISRIIGYDKKEYKEWLDSNRQKPTPGIPSRKCGPGCKCNPDQGQGCHCHPDCKCGREQTIWEWIFGVKK